MKKFLLLTTCAIFLSGCAFSKIGTFDDAQPTSTSGNQSNTPSPSQTYAEESLAGVGQSISTEEYEVTLNSAEFSDKGTLSQSPENDHYLVLDLTVENLTGDEVTISSIMSFNLVGSDDYAYDVAIFAETKAQLDGTIGPGSTLRGQVAFDVPELSYYVLGFTFNVFGDAVYFKIPKP